MKGRKLSMEKLLSLLMTFGIVMVVAGTLTACNVNKENTIKEAATQVEINVNEPIDVYDEEINRIESEQAHQEKIDQAVKVAESTIYNEAKYYWDIYLKNGGNHAENGLTYEIFRDLYAYYRAGLDKVMRADEAYQFTLIEIDRVYGEVAVNTYEYLDASKYVTVKADGSYECSAEFISALQNYYFFEGATPEEFNEALKIVLPSIKGMTGEQTHQLLEDLSAMNYHDSLKTIDESNGVVTEEDNSQKPADVQPNPNANQSQVDNEKNNANVNNTQPTQSNDEVITDTKDWGVNTGNSSIWGDANTDTSTFGGGELIDGGHEWNIH